jgi:hypothetical protein
MRLGVPITAPPRIPSNADLSPLIAVGWRLELAIGLEIQHSPASEFRSVPTKREADYALDQVPVIQGK